MVGKVVSHYKILEKLGEGGMGVVYKAEDQNLDRLVALKFLPAQLSPTDESKSRFIREARAAAALNHPNICTVHDIQEHDGQIYIVMEYVEGETLKEKKRAGIAPKHVIDIGIQIAEGLAAAHDKGIVHRDIKPENIMVRKDGIVQIMDFGLAKLRGATHLTKEGSTVGTVGYMSPEQVEGRDTDHRSDIFSLGVVLYELFTGEPPFKGIHETAIMYEIVNVDAQPMSAVKPDIDPGLDALVLECLEKDPNERTQSAKQLALDLKRFKRESSKTRPSRVKASLHSFAVAPKMSAGRSEARWSRVWMVVALVSILLAAVLGVLRFLESAPALPVITSSILPPQRQGFSTFGGGHIAISPDGHALAYVANDSTGRNSLWVQPLNFPVGQPLNGTEGASYPFWSADNRYIGFFMGGKLKKVDASGGPPQILCDAPAGRGGTWNRDGVILFAPSSGGVIYRVSAAGGVATEVTVLDSSRGDQSHRWPYFLPDNEHFFYLALRSTGMVLAAAYRETVYVCSISKGDRKVVLDASTNVSYASNHVLFVREGILMAQPFDEGKLELKGDAVPIAEQVAVNQGFGLATFSSSLNGMLIYQRGASGADQQLIWFDRKGTQIGAIPGRASYLSPRISPDGKRIAVDLFDTQSRSTDIWLCELGRGVWTRFTFAPGANQYPTWSPDGTRIAFSSNRKGNIDLYTKVSTGAGADEVLYEGGRLGRTPGSWSSDGKYLIFTYHGDPKTGLDLWILPLIGERKPFVFLQTEFSETLGRFSPDNRWIAYASNESGKDQVYVRPFGGKEGKWQISDAGGTQPRWRGDGKELFYLAANNRLMAVDVRAKGSILEAGTPKPLFEIHPTTGNIYDVTADGQHFLVSTFVGDLSASPLTLVVNWPSVLKKK